MAARDDRGFTLLELLTVVALIGILSMLGMAGLVAARRAANEASAIASLRAVAVAQQAYAASCAGGFYASSLPILGSAPAQGPPFLPPELTASATVEKHGYRITMARGTDSTPATEPACNPLGDPSNLADAFYATADPVNAFTGLRHFWVNQHAVIFFNPDGPIQHRAAHTTPAAPTLEGQSPSGGAGAGGTGSGKPGEQGSEAPPEGGSGLSTPDSKGAGPQSPQRR